jgi:hypothetical protein
MGELAVRGRSREMARTLEALRRADGQGRGCVLSVTGDPGIGKTTLLEAIRAQALSIGFAVGFAKADEVSAIAPGAPVLLALRSGSRPLLDDAAFRSLAALYDKTRSSMSSWDRWPTSMSWRLPRTSWALPRRPRLPRGCAGSAAIRCWPFSFRGTGARPGARPGRRDHPDVPGDSPAGAGAVPRTGRHAPSAASGSVGPSAGAGDGRADAGLSAIRAAPGFRG